MTSTRKRAVSTAGPSRATLAERKLLGSRTFAGTTAPLGPRDSKPHRARLLALLSLSGLLLLAACLEDLAAAPSLTEPVDRIPLGFPRDFPVLVDTGGNGAGDRLTGFGAPRSQRSDRRPVVLIHGNGTPAQEIWRHYYHWLLESGYSAGDIWVGTVVLISGANYGLGSAMGDPDVFARYVLPHLTGADVHN